MGKFTKKLPDWIEPGMEPTVSKKTSGWAANERPPAEYMNWFQNRTYEVMKELQEDALHKEDLFEVSNNLAVNVMDLQVSIENFPLIIPESNDSPRIQRAIDYCEANGIGRLKAKGEYTLQSNLKLVSNLIIEGSSPIHTKFWVMENVTAFEITAKRNITLKDLAIDGAHRLNTGAIISSGESVTINLDNIWIDSVDVGYDAEYSYFINITNVRMMGTHTPYLLRNSVNVCNILNSSAVVPPSVEGFENSGFAITAFNGSCLTLKGCSFEGEGGSIQVYNWNGFTMDAVYQENQSGIQGEAYVYLGNGSGRPARGVSIIGCNFVGGFRYAISMATVDGVTINGNTFDTDVSAFEYYQYDDSPKIAVNLGQNSYGETTGKITYSGRTNDDLNSNETVNVLNPLKFEPHREPLSSHMGVDDVVIFNDGYGLKTVNKMVTGETNIKPIMTGETGVATLPIGQTRLNIPHNLEKVPDVVLCTPSSDIGSWWIETKNEWSFVLRCYETPTVATS